MTAARPLFPVADYGYRGFLNHPGAKIYPADPVRPNHLAVISPNPRELRDGRYHPGWDCVEASHYLGKQLSQAGIEHKIERIACPAFGQDIVVQAEGRYYSLTPGVRESIETCHFCAKGAVVNPDLLWASHRWVAMRLGDYPKPIGWDPLQGGSTGILHSFGVFHLEEAVFNLIVQSLLIHSGQVLGKIETSFAVTLRNLAKTRLMFLLSSYDGELPSIIAERQRHSKAENFIVGKTSLFDRVEAANHKTAHELAPLVFGAVEPGWANHFTSISYRILIGSFADRLERGK